MSNEVAELACTYAALILHDDGQDITGTLYNNCNRIKNCHFSQSCWS